MPFEVPKITNILLVQNVSEILFIIMCGISTVSYNSVYQWTMFPITAGLHLFFIISYNYNLRQHFRNIEKIKRLRIKVIIALCLMTGLGIWYNLFVIKKESYTAQVITLHNVTIMLGWFILVIGIGITKNLIFTRRSVEYYNNPELNSIETKL